MMFFKIFHYEINYLKKLNTDQLYNKKIYFDKELICDINWTSIILLHFVRITNFLYVLIKYQL